MAKELPFFKFTSNEWLTGDINFESFEIQGLFISVCSTYWSKDCNITLTKLKQRLSNASSEMWQSLIDGGYIKVEKDIVRISFLDEQMFELSEQHRKKVEAGRKGGKASVKQRLSKAKASVKHKDIDIEKDIEEDLLTPTPFDVFWKAYGKNVGLVPSQREWAKIDEREYQKIIDHVPKFVKASGNFLKNPENYLKNKCWLDSELPNYTDKKDDAPKTIADLGLNL